MNLDAIFRICRQLCDFCNKTYVDFSFSIITNGTLLKRKSVRELCSLGLRGIQITLDGPSEIHDKRRPKNNGEGSFYDVFRNLKQVVDLVKLVSIRINLDFQNSETIPRFLHELTSQGMHRQNVQIQIARTYNIDLASEIAQRRQKEYKNITVKRMIELYSLAKQLGFQIAIDKDSAFMPYEICMFVSPNSFVIDPEGWIYKCIGFVSNPEFRIGHVSKENFTDTLAEHIILGTKITQDPFCNKCAFRPVCNGGCRYLTYVQTGDPWKRICPKQYFQRASLELLRINYLSERELENGNK
ncbi:MAG: SPASM domain-containing protein [Methanophagales archaeon]|nr:SPASM domain-containing protein [Methanophagales archaeon]